MISIRDQKGKKNQLEKTADDYLDRLGVSQQLVPGVLKDLAHGIAMKDSGSYPALVKMYKPFKIKLNKFESMPMHMCFLGCTKNLVSKAHITVNRRMNDQNECWPSLDNLMQRTQKLINTISIDWCMSMSFSGKIFRVLEHPPGNLTTILPSQGCVCFTLPLWKEETFQSIL